MQLSRMYAREILAHLDADVEPEVRSALEQYVAGVHPVPQAVSSAPLVTFTDYQSDGMPPYVPLTYSDEQLAKTKVDDGAGGTRRATQADVAEINEVKRRAHVAQWNAAKNYMPNLNEKDAVNAAFAPPEYPNGYGVIEEIKVGEKNSAGDECIYHNHSGVSVYRCTHGHGYEQSRSLRGCPACFNAGGRSQVSEDRGVIESEDSRW